MEQTFLPPFLLHKLNCEEVTGQWWSTSKYYGWWIKWNLMCYAHVSKGTPKYLLITSRDMCSRGQYWFMEKKCCGKANVYEGSWAQLQTKWIIVSINMNRGSLWHKRTRETSLDKRQCHDLGHLLWSRDS